MENNIVIKNLKIAGKFGEFTLEELSMPASVFAQVSDIEKASDVFEGIAEVVGFGENPDNSTGVEVAEEYETTKDKENKVPSPAVLPKITEKVKDDLKKMGNIKRIRENEFSYEDDDIKVSVEINNCGYVELNAKGKDCGFCIYVNNKPPKNSEKDMPYIVETLKLINDVGLREYFVNLVTKYADNID